MLAGSYQKQGKARGRCQVPGGWLCVWAMHFSGRGLRAVEVEVLGAIHERGLRAVRGDVGAAAFEL